MIYYCSYMEWSHSCKKFSYLDKVIEYNNELTSEKDMQNLKSIISSDCNYSDLIILNLIKLKDDPAQAIEQLRKENEMLKQESADFKKLLDQVIKETGYTSG